jgi:hypothetical protein
MVYLDLREVGRYIVGMLVISRSTAFTYRLVDPVAGRRRVQLAPVPSRMFALARQKATLFQWLAVPLWFPTGKD